ncbi:Protein of unknown function, partial [Gryllus bimaculatus]
GRGGVGDPERRRAEARGPLAPEHQQPVRGPEHRPRRRAPRRPLRQRPGARGGHEPVPERQLAQRGCGDAAGAGAGRGRPVYAPGTERLRQLHSGAAAAPLGLPAPPRPALVALPCN